MTVALCGFEREGVEAVPGAVEFRRLPLVDPVSNFRSCSSLSLTGVAGGEMQCLSLGSSFTITTRYLPFVYAIQLSQKRLPLPNVFHGL